MTYKNKCFAELGENDKAAGKPELSDREWNRTKYEYSDVIPEVAEAYFAVGESQHNKNK
jgi:hypothetical protein